MEPRGLDEWSREPPGPKVQHSPRVKFTSIEAEMEGIDYKVQRSPLDIKRYLFNRFFDPTSMPMFVPSSPRNATSHTKTTSSQLHKQMAVPSPRTLSRTTTANLLGHKDKRPCARRSFNGPYHHHSGPSQLAGLSSPSLSIARLSGLLHQQPVPRSWSKELAEMHKAAVQWPVDQVLNFANRGLFRHMITLLQVPELQRDACAMLADLGVRCPKALSGTEVELERLLLLPLARIDGQVNALKLLYALVKSNQRGRLIVAKSVPLLTELAALLRGLNKTPRAINEGIHLSHHNLWPPETKLLAASIFLQLMKWPDSATEVFRLHRLSVDPLCELFKRLSLLIVSGKVCGSSSTSEERVAELTKMLMGCMSHMTSDLSATQRVVHPTVHNVLPLLVQLLVHENKGVASCALSCLGSVGERQDPETRGVLKDALEEGGGVVVEVLVQTLRQRPIRVHKTRQSVLLLWLIASGDSYYKKVELVSKSQTFSAVSSLLLEVFRICLGGKRLVISFDDDIVMRPSGGIDKGDLDEKGSGNVSNIEGSTSIGNVKGSGNIEAGAEEISQPVASHKYMEAGEQPEDMEYQEGIKHPEGVCQVTWSSCVNGALSESQDNDLKGRSFALQEGQGEVYLDDQEGQGEVYLDDQDLGNDVMISPLRQQGQNDHSKGEEELDIHHSSQTVGVKVADSSKRVASTGYSRSDVEMLVSNCFGLASSLLALLGNSWERRDQAAKSMLPDAATMAKVAASCIATEHGNASGDGWCLEVQERSLSVLSNMCLHQQMAAVAASIAGAPALSLQVIRSALKNMLSDRASRLVLSAPSALLTQAASLLANYLRVAPTILSGDQASESLVAMGPPQPIALDSKSLIAPPSWTLSPSEGLELMCKALVHLQHDLSSASGKYLHPPIQLQAVAAAVASLSRAVTEPMALNGRFASSENVSQASIILGQQLKILFVPEARASGAPGLACIVALSSLMSCGFLHPELPGLTEPLLASLPSILRQGQLVAVLCLVNELSRSKHMASKMVCNTSVVKALLSFRQRADKQGIPKQDLQLLLTRLKKFDRYHALQKLFKEDCVDDEGSEDEKRVPSGLEKEPPDGQVSSSQDLEVAEPLEENKTVLAE